VAKDKRMISLVNGSSAAERFDHAQDIIKRATGSDTDLSGPQLITVVAEIALPLLEEMARTPEGSAQLTRLVLASVSSSRTNRSESGS